MINLGSEAKDTVSGFKGIVIGRTMFLNGCARCGVQPKVKKDGTLPEVQWFDEPQLQEVQKKIKTGSRCTGGPMVSMPTRNMPK